MASLNTSGNESFSHLSHVFRKFLKVSEPLLSVKSDFGSQTCP